MSCCNHIPYEVGRYRPNSAVMNSLEQEQHKQREADFEALRAAIAKTPVLLDNAGLIEAATAILAYSRND